MAFNVTDTLDGTTGVHLTDGPNWNDLEAGATFRYNGSGTGVDSTDFFTDAAIVRTETFAPNQFAEIILRGVVGTGGGAGAGISLRGSGFDTTRTYYRIVVNEANLEVGKFVNGSYTQLATTGGLTITDGDVLRAEVHDNIIRVYLNGSPLGSDIADSTIATGKPGLAFSAVMTDFNIDNFIGGDLSKVYILQIASALDPSGAGPAPSFGSPVLAGSTILAIQELDGTQSLADPTDNIGTVYTGVVNLNTSDDQRLRVWIGVAATTSALTVTFRDGAFNGAIIYELHASDDNPIELVDVDVVEHDGIASGTDTIICPTIDALADCLAIGICGSDSGTIVVAPSVGTGFSLDKDQNLGTSGFAADDHLVSEHKYVGAGTVTPTFSPSSAWQGAAASLTFRVTPTVEPPEAGEAGPTLIRVFANRQNW